jgi:hypothetical protein
MIETRATLTRETRRIYMQYFRSRMVLATVCALLLGSSSFALGQAAPNPISVWIKDIDENVFRQNPKSNQSLVQAIKDDGDYFRDETVELSGSLTRLIPTPGVSNEVSYDFQDSYGFSIRVKIDKRQPRENALLQRHGDGVFIRGVVGVENGLAVITQPRLGPPWEDQVVVSERTPAPLSGLMIALIAGAGIVLLVIIVLVIFLLRKGSGGQITEIPRGQTQRGADNFGATTKVDLTQKMMPVTSTVISSTKRSVIPEPAATTVKMLPGFFKILSGTAKGRRLNIFAPLTTIGRLENSNDERGLNHMGFDYSEQAVSRKQAELMYVSQKNEFILKNLADPVTKNASMVNGLGLGMDKDAILKDGDRIQFGPIELEFHTISSVIGS